MKDFSSNSFQEMDNIIEKKCIKLTELHSSVTNLPSLSEKMDV